MMKIKIAPSILAADFGKLNEEILGVENFADFIHVDVMDGHFVPNISIGAPVVKCIKSKLPLYTHLMIENPEKYVEDFVKAGSARIIVHVEAAKNLKSLIEKIKSLGVSAGVSIKPATSVEAIKDVLDIVDDVLVMTVEPGFGGQEFMPDMLPKIKALRAMGYKGDISVDGGINDKTGKMCAEAGANILITGSYIFKAEDRKTAIESLRSLAV